MSLVGYKLQDYENCVMTDKHPNICLWFSLYTPNTCKA